MIDLSSALSQTAAFRLQQENESLRRLLGASLPAGWPLQPAKILSFKNNVLTLNVGLKDGVETGMNVLVVAGADGHTGIIIGKINQAQVYLSQASLIDGAKVTTSDGATGKLARQNQSLQLIDVEQKYSLRPDDLIFTAGTDGWLPDLLVGRVGKIEMIPTAIYQTAIVVPAIDLSVISQVVVVKLAI